MFIELLTSIVSASNHTKCVWLSNQKCMIQPILINLHCNEYSQELHYYPFAVKLDRCVGSCNTLNDLSNKVCIPNKTEDLNLSLCKMITGRNESKTLKNMYHVKSSQIMVNVGVNVKNIVYVKNIIFGILLPVVAKMVTI